MPIVIEHNCTTGERVMREMTRAERIEHEARVADGIRQAAEEAERAKLPTIEQQIKLLSERVSALEAAQNAGGKR
jgi:hypothetical protein